MKHLQTSKPSAISWSMSYYFYKNIWKHLLTHAHVITSNPCLKAPFLTGKNQFLALKQQLQCIFLSPLHSQTTKSYKNSLLIPSHHSTRLTLVGWALNLINDSQNYYKKGLCPWHKSFPVFLCFLKTDFFTFLKWTLTPKMESPNEFVF